jgi:hypothetical protein
MKIIKMEITVTSRVGVYRNPSQFQIFHGLQFGFLKISKKV